MKNIAVFVKNLTSGGAEKQSILLAKSLSDSYKVHYIVFNGTKVHQKYMDMLQGDKSISIKTFNGNHIERFFSLIKYVRINKIQIIFSYLTAANLYACWVGCITNAKVFTGLRNAELPYLKCIADKFLANSFAKLAIANCYSGKSNFVSKGFNNEKVIVIPNCFENIKPYIDKVLHEKVTIITVGRFVPQKDYETAIKAISELKKSCSNIIFEIVGYGVLESNIRNWINQYEISDIVNVHINPNNIPELLDNADIYLSTSLFEGTSNSIMEGMNADLPIVATNVGDNAYLVENGVNGLLAEIKDYKTISKSLLRLVQNFNERKDMGQESKRKLAELYSMNTFKERYISVIENCFNQ